MSETQAATDPRCSMCGEPIDSGDTEALQADGTYICEGCDEGLDETDSEAETVAELDEADATEHEG